MTIALRDAVAACDARVLEPAKLPDRAHVATDTRALAPGDAFVALRGERFDGHAYVRAALAAGASAVVVDDAGAVPPGVPALVVADTAAAYLACAGVARRASRARVVAITGSAGKTTTKAFLAQLLGRLSARSVVATPANENNEIGVAKLFLGLPDDAAFVVVEFGARHPGEIAPLARAALPEVAVLTNVGDAHLEIFGSPEQLADTKWGIFSTGARAVLGAADRVSRARATSLARPIVWFSCGDDTAPRTLPPDERSVHVGPATLVVCDGDAVESFATHLSVPGAHNRANVAAAAAAALALGFDAPAIAAHLGEFALPRGRYERIAIDDFALLYDAYNASMSGTLATLASFANEAAGRRIAVLGSMAELGADAAAMHERVGEAAATCGLEALLVGGEFAASLARGARGAGLDAARIVAYGTNDDAVAWLRAHARAGDLVLLKASRRYRFEEIVDGLRTAYAG